MNVRPARLDHEPFPAVVALAVTPKLCPARLDHEPFPAVGAFGSYTKILCDYGISLDTCDVVIR